MSAHIDEMEQIQLRTMLHKMADFIAMYEAAEQKLIAREKALEEKLKESEKIIGEQLATVRGVLREFEAIMTETGAARWRLAAEQALKEGDKHLAEIQQKSDEFLSRTKESCERLDRAVSYTVKNVSQAVSLFQVDDFKHLVSHGCEQINQVYNQALKKIDDTVRWFHWRNLALVVAITLLVTMVIGLYINDEWPWEMHRDVMQQRLLAHAVVESWPELSVEDQQRILHNTSKPTE